MMFSNFFQKNFMFIGIIFYNFDIISVYINYCMLTLQF